MPEADPSPEPKPAPRLGSYRLVQPLGSGGMSNVFRAVHEESGNVVAVKVLPRTLAKNITLLQRFIREAKSAEALDHPNIVAIYDRGFDQGRHYLVLEFVEGRDLHDRVRMNGPLAPDEAIRFVREVAEGLQYAASQGMIHRDVKPANLLMTPDGHAKIIDLGLALQTDDEDERVTRDGTTVGTVDYMAPEQARDSRQTSERSDIYSLGCTFYYLLTGSPPFPGGGLADKLSRHFKAPIPDVRAHRTDVPEELSLLIRKMMEKKPDRRFSGYDQLIAALDSIGQNPTPGARIEVLDALIVDDDDDDEIGLAPTESTITRGKFDNPDRPPSTRDHGLMAEIVDDDEDDAPPTPKASRSSSALSKSPARAKSPRNEPPEPAEVSLAELAALDADDEVTKKRQGRRSPASSASAKTLSSSATPRTPAPLPAAILEEEEAVEGISGPPRRSSGDELPLKTWIAAGVMVGLSIAIVGFVVSMAISMMKPAKPPEISERPIEVASSNDQSTSVTPIPRIKGPNRPPPKVDPSKTSTTKPAPEVSKIVDSPPAEEKAYPPEWESRLFRPSAPKPLILAERQRIVVRRVAEAGDEAQTSSLASALSRAADVVEIADTGPFFEDDCQVSGKSRLIRARGGIRPMIRIDLTSNEIVKEQAAKFILGGAKVDHLVLEGLDIAVDVRDLPDHQACLFLCQGADLTLRDCTLTVVNANVPSRTRRFSIFRVEEGAKPNRITLERSTIRGPVRTLIDLAAARAEIIFDRSLVVGDAGPLISFEPAEKSARLLFFHRSLIATRGLVLEFPGKGNPPQVRSLGSTFARIDGGSVGTMFASKASFATDPPTVLDWSGEDNAFVGWSAWLTSGPEASQRVAGVEKVRADWPGSDSTSRDLPDPWPVSVLKDDLIPADLASLATDRRGTLIRIASPHPRLRDLTIGSLARLTVPELSATLIPPFVAPIVPQAGPVSLTPKPLPQPAPQPNEKGPRPKVPTNTPKAVPPKPSPGNPMDVAFNVQDMQWQGDLGQFLAETLTEGTTRATIRVRGTGVFATSPIRLPDGLSIAILGDSIEGSKIPMTTFFPKPTASDRSMFELHGGDLTIANLAFSTENSPRPKHWVLVEDGLLAIKHSRFRDPAGMSPSTGASISFVARGTAPIAPRVGPFVSATDRPTTSLKNCLIWTAGDAISAEVGRGTLDLENCLILSGGPAFTLLPQNVGRDKFEADLVMDRCTIATDRTSILLGPLAGDRSGPARPWLISTRRSIFPRTQTSTAGALLQVDPDAMARGVVFWQSIADAYDVGRFLASTGPQPAGIPPADLKKQWTDLWGIQHTSNDHGPNPRRSEQILRFKDKDRLKPGRVIPGNLELDTNVQKDLGADFKNLPPSPKP